MPRPPRSRAPKSGSGFTTRSRWTTVGPLRSNCFARSSPKKCNGFAAKSVIDRFQHGKFDLAARLFQEIIEQDQLEEFLTLKAYPYLD